MSTVIRPELSKNSKWWIGKHRYYELKHFCLQYPEWKSLYSKLEPSGNRNDVSDKNEIEWHDPTGKTGTLRAYLKHNMERVENAAYEADSELAPFILRSVTEGHNFTYLKECLGMPCGKDMYYDRYRKFFYILSKT